MEYICGLRSRSASLESPDSLQFAQTTYVMFEATVINTLIEYWGYNKSPAILITASLLFFLLLNIYRADLFGEAECTFIPSRQLK